MAIRARAGQLRHRVTLQEKVETQTSTGAIEHTWQDIASIPNVWARKRDLSAEERFESQQTQHQVTTEFVIRHRTDVDSNMAVLHNGTLYDIVSIVEDDTAKTWLALECTRGVTDGG